MPARLVALTLPLKPLTSMYSSTTDPKKSGLDGPHLYGSGELLEGGLGEQELTMESRLAVFQSTSGGGDDTGLQTSVTADTTETTRGGAAKTARQSVNNE